LNANEYVDLRTGEVLAYDHGGKNDNGHDIANVRRSVARLRQLINCNFAGGADELFVTLTYAQNMTNSHQLYEDVRRYIQRLYYARPDLVFRWLSAIEPQGRGAWHVHLLLKALNAKLLYISNDEMARLWGLGFVKVARLYGCDNVGAYLSAYLLNTRSKKGGRLHMYPKGMRLYRCSQNCIRPVTQHINQAELDKLLKSGRVTWSREVAITDDDGNVIQRIMKLQLRTK